MDTETEVSFPTVPMPFFVKSLRACLDYCAQGPWASGGLVHVIERLEAFAGTIERQHFADRLVAEKALDDAQYGLDQVSQTFLGSFLLNEEGVEPRARRTLAQRERDAIELVLLAGKMELLARQEWIDGAARLATVVETMLHDARRTYRMAQVVEESHRAVLRILKED